VLHIKGDVLQHRDEGSNTCAVSDQDKWNGRVRFSRRLWKVKNAIGTAELAFEFCCIEILRIGQEISTHTESLFISFFKLGFRYNYLQIFRFLLKLAHERIVGNWVKSWLDSWDNIRFFHHVLWNLRLIQFCQFWIIQEVLRYVIKASDVLPRFFF